MKEGTISSAAVKALLHLNGLRKIDDIHDYIIEKELYDFQGQNPLHILTTQINKKCSNSNITEKSRELLFFREGDRFGLLNQLSEIEKLKYMTDEQYEYWLMHHGNTENQNSDLENRVSEIENTLNDFPDIIQKAKSAEKSFENAKQSYEEELNLHAARRYWQTKRKTHMKEAKSKLKAFLIVLVITLILLVGGYYFLEPIQEIVLNGKKTYNFNLGDIGFLVFTSSIGLWLSRILLKIILSNLHLQEEAREKETMIVSYLALIKDGGMEKDDRNIILSSIFRPSSNGIIQDDTSVTLLDVLNTFKAKG